MQPQSAFPIRIHLLSDWHIGSGAGRPGDVDRLVQRDREGFPFIPAKTLTGIWRDACEQVAYGLDNGTSGNWSAWVAYLFGDQPALAQAAVSHAPREAALSVRLARLPADLRAAVGARSSLKAALTFVKPGVSLDSQTGCARQEYLRFEEMARAGATLVADCELALDRLKTEQQQAAFCLAVAGTRMIERLGGKRRRGAGRCTVEIGSTRRYARQMHRCINWIEAHPSPPLPPPVSSSSSETSWAGWTPAAAESTWQAVPLQIEARSPLVIAQRTLGNVVETLDYIPGTHLLRLVVSCLRSLDVDLSGAIAHSDLIVTNATLEIQGQRSLPVPYALFGEKLTGGLAKGQGVYNCFVGDTAPGQLKGERSGYLVPQPGHLPHYATVQCSVETHNTVEDGTQCPTEAVGGVYSYTAIAPRTLFQAELRLNSTIAAQLSEKDANWMQRLSGSHRLGQSKKDDYGAVNLQVLNIPPDNSSDNSSAQASDSPESTLTVWLLSDLLLRDERLRPTANTDALRKVLEDQLSVKLSPREGDTPAVMARQHRLESWHVRWGLPRPSLAGLKGGSCFVFTVVKGTLKASQLETLTQQGLGERRAEGFGQVCFNAPLLTQSTATLTRTDSSSSPQSPDLPLNQPLLDTQDNALKTYARGIERAAWRTALRQKVLALAATPESRRQILGITDNKPTQTQLGALRSVLSRLQQHGDRTTVVSWLDHLQATPTREAKWPQGSLTKIRDLMTNAELIWQHLQWDTPTLAQLTMTPDATTALKQELWAEAVKTLVDACIRAHKRSQEGA